MDYVKELALTLVNPGTKESLQKHEKWMYACVDKYNCISNESTVNKKRAEIVCIEENRIILRLYSETNLEKAPGRALSLLSRLLITNDGSNEFDEFFLKNTFHGKLFRTASINENETNVVLEDVDVIKILMDYVVTPKSKIPDTQKRAFNEIKRLTQEYLVKELEVIKLLKERRTIGNEEQND